MNWKIRYHDPGPESYAEADARITLWIWQEYASILWKVPKLPWWRVLAAYV